MADEAESWYLALKAVMMPRDTNQHGAIFGGVLLSYLDQAGAVGAHYAIARAGWPAQALVTVAMNSVEFHEPVYVGDVLSFWTEVKRIGTTSITMHVVAETEFQGQAKALTEAEIVYVAVNLDDEERRPVPIRGAEQESE